jgi:hypothetical protein
MTRGGTRAAAKSGQYTVSPAQCSDAGSRERLDRPAAPPLLLIFQEFADHIGAGCLTEHRGGRRHSNEQSRLVEVTTPGTRGGVDPPPESAPPRPSRH